MNNIKMFTLFLSILLIFSCSDKTSTGVTTFPNSIHATIANNKELSVTLKKIEITNAQTTKTIAKQTADSEIEFDNLENGKYALFAIDKDSNMFLKYITIDNNNHEVVINSLSKFVVTGFYKGINTPNIEAIGVAKAKIENSGQYFITLPKSKVSMIYKTDNKAAIMDISLPNLPLDTTYLLDVNCDIDSLEYSGSEYSSSIEVSNIKPVIYDIDKQPSYYNSAFNSVIYFIDNSEYFGVDLVNSNSLMLDNFESKTLPKSLIQPVTNGWWYTASDSISTCSFELQQELLNSDSTNTYLHFVSNFNEDNNISFALFGLSFGQQYQEFDISKVDTVSFKIRCNDVVRFSLESPKIDSMNSDNHFGYIIDATTQWKEIKIATSSLTRFTPTTLQWSDVNRYISRLEFERALYIGSSGVGDFYIDVDDIMFNNINLKEFINN